MCIKFNTCLIDKNLPFKLIFIEVNMLNHRHAFKKSLLSQKNPKIEYVHILPHISQIVESLEPPTKEMKT